MRKEKKDCDEQDDEVKEINQAIGIPDVFYAFYHTAKKQAIDYLQVKVLLLINDLLKRGTGLNNFQGTS